MTALACLVSTLLRPRFSLGAFALLILVGSSVPMAEGPPIDFPVAPDRIAHGLAYALLAALAVRAVWRPTRPWWYAVTAVLGAITYGALIENWQDLLGNRSCELADGIANAIGAGLGGGTFVVSAYCRRRARIRKGRIQVDHDQRQRRETD